MAKDKLVDYDSTASGNLDVGGVSVAEGMLPSNVNNAIREQMSHLKDFAEGTEAINALAVDNLKLDGNTISSTDTNGDITIDPDGTGDTIIASGNVGIGTSSPSGLQKTLNIDGDSLGASLALDGGSNFAVMFSGATASDPASLYSNTGFKIATATAKDATGFSEKMRLDSSGNLLVGTTSVNAAGVISVDFDGQAKQGITLDDTYTSTGGYYIYFRNSANAQAGAISHNGSTTVNYSTSSDYRLKTAVNYNWDATTRLKQLRPARFDWIADGDDAVPVDGFLAHEVQTVVPEAITGTHDGMMDEEYEVTPAVLDDDGNEVTPAVMGTRSVPDYQGIDQSKLVPLLVKTIQELEARITALES